MELKWFHIGLKWLQYRKIIKSYTKKPQHLPKPQLPLPCMNQLTKVVPAANFPTSLCCSDRRAEKKNYRVYDREEWEPNVYVWEFPFPRPLWISLSSTSSLSLAIAPSSLSSPHRSQLLPRLPITFMSPILLKRLFLCSLPPSFIYMQKYKVCVCVCVCSYTCVCVKERENGSWVVIPSLFCPATDEGQVSRGK